MKGTSHHRGMPGDEQQLHLFRKNVQSSYNKPQESLQRWCRSTAMHSRMIFHPALTTALDRSAIFKSAYQTNNNDTSIAAYDLNYIYLICTSYSFVTLQSLIDSMQHSVCRCGRASFVIKLSSADTLIRPRPSLEKLIAMPKSLNISKGCVHSNNLVLNYTILLQK